MLSVIHRTRKSLGRSFLVLCAVVLSACVPVGGTSTGPATGSGGTVQVALLVPSGSGQSQDELFGQNLENAARLAMADLSGVTIDLRVYRTGGSPAQASALAKQAVDEGAQVILGPFYSEEANAAGVAVASSGVNVLAFSNNAAIAGGNVFVLGQTFDNTARRLASFAVRSGKSKILIVHDRNVAGEVGKAAIERGVAAAGGSVVGVTSYEFSQNGIVQAATGIVSSARSSGATALFLTADTAGALPLLSQLLVDNGIDRASTQFIGLTRWDIPPATLALPGVQGGWFAMPDPGLQAQFQSRYLAAYGTSPSAVAGLAYDGIAAIGALARSSNGAPISRAALTQSAGFAGVSGIFRLLPNGTNERGLAVAQIRSNQVVVIDSAPRSFAGAGF
ncbi:penicillin-binding protein activator [Tabrizicola piscis]|uniref:Penicillin-binding protein activator n=1 Tax=Tabrizicola piscis TaxID=2494374 RepID=A0A3S8U7Z1_9RHOB|nr:penicillin-binding protein activator [Tabrizicola piscis]AZL59842.1 penicillin-binding protein activator [Tabrizicola piscis]